MNTKASFKKLPVEFFLLVFFLSIPFWLIGSMSQKGLPLPVNLPVSALSFISPMIAALILVYKENKIAGIKQLLRKVFDYKKIERKTWYIPIIFLLPVTYLLSYGIMRLLGKPLPQEIQIPFSTLPLLFIGFFIPAVCEELGWTGYAVDPMQNRLSTLKAGIILGAIWGILHIIPDIQAHRNLTWIFWQRGVYSVALRVLIVWIYNNTGKSLFATSFFHDMDNVSWALFPNNGSHYDPEVTGIITASTMISVVFLWGVKTLAKYRYASKYRYTSKYT
ncbi:MAG: CPBP family intramembrane glutamic endopeptidase [Methanosarcina sp.]